MKIKPKNWDEFQQYKDRKPQWIKFHRDLLNNFAYSSVQIGTKAAAPLLWLLASEYEDGIIDASIEEISFRIHIDIKTVTKAISELIDAGFFISLDLHVQDCTEVYENVPREEKRREREEREKEIEEIINHLNQTTKSKYKKAKETVTLINARLDDGFTVDDFKQVHINKYAEWHDDDKMQKYLRPATLYNSKKFEGYLNQKISDYEKIKMIQSHSGASVNQIINTMTESGESQRIANAKHGWADA